MFNGEKVREKNKEMCITNRHVVGQTFRISTYHGKGRCRKNPMLLGTCLHNVDTKSDIFEVLANRILYSYSRT